MARALPHRKHARPEPSPRERGRELTREQVHEHTPVAPELPELDRLIHERIRLGIVSALAEYLDQMEQWIRVTRDE